MKKITVETTKVDQIINKTARIAVIVAISALTGAYFGAHYTTQYHANLAKASKAVAGRANADSKPVGTPQTPATVQPSK